jgi:predicted nucleic acid-binding protein
LPGWPSKEEHLVQRILKNSRLHEGEAESLAISKSRGLPVIQDDKEERMCAEMLGVELTGTAGVLLEAFIKGNMKQEQLEEAIKDLSATIWLSPAVVAEILKRAREAIK